MPENETYELPADLAPRRAGLLAEPRHPDDAGDGPGGWPGVGQQVEELRDGNEP